MITALEDFRGRFSLTFAIDVIDIDQHSKMEPLWGDKVPVLLDGDEEICHYFFDDAALNRHFFSGNTDAVIAVDGPNRLK